MPTYEYRCEECGHEFELFQSITAKPVRKCPGCGRLKVRRLISGGGGLLFKGSGFYITDYRSEGYKAAAKKDSAPAKSDSGKSDSGKSSDLSGKSAGGGKKPAAKSSSAAE